MDKYKKIKVLGKGAFGKAYLVEDAEKNEMCVIKQMETSMMKQTDVNEAIKEAAVLQKMCHPNIVKFHEVFMTKRGRLCIVMDYADGGDLHKMIKNQGEELLPEDKILLMFAQICLALKHVHERKVLHRDLKTQNIFLCQDGSVKLGDFGIARVLEATKDLAQTMVGTPYYLSPEIIEEKPYSYKSDSWSLGVVLYEMSTLKHPFDAENLHTLAVKILSGEFPPPSPQYSEDLAHLIKWLLSKNPEDRPSVIEILQQDFMKPFVIQACVKGKLNYEDEVRGKVISTKEAAEDKPADTKSPDSKSPDPKSKPKPAPKKK
eukprot:Platyproteum_vivax@DN5737_c0_g1_i1.p1